MDDDISAYNWHSTLENLNTEESFELLHEIVM